MERIHVTLPSNSSMTVYKDNKPQHYKTSLAQELQLEGKWEASLSKIDLIYDWCNITTDSKFKVYVFRESADIPGIGGFDQGDITLSKGFFESPLQIGEHLLKTIISMYDTNQLFKLPPKAPMKVEYNSITNRVEFSGNEFYLTPKLSSTVEHLTAMGFNETVITNMFGTGYKFPNKATKAPTLARSNHVYVYSDVCKHRLVGDAQVPLLDHFPITAKHGESQTHEFKNPIFVPVTTGYISTIEIKITDDTGELIPIQSGKVICDLEFRKCNPLPLSATPISATTKD